MLENYSDVLTVDDIMKILHIGRSNVYKLLQLKIIPSIRLGKKYVIPKSLMIDFLNNR